MNQFSSAEDDFNSKETQSLITVLSTLSKLLDPASQQVLHNLQGVAGMCVVAVVWEDYQTGLTSEGFDMCACSAFCRPHHVKVTGLVRYQAHSCQMPARTVTNKLSSHPTPARSDPAFGHLEPE